MCKPELKDQWEAEKHLWIPTYRKFGTDTGGLFDSKLDDRTPGLFKTEFIGTAIVEDVCKMLGEFKCNSNEDEVPTVVQESILIPHGKIEYHDSLSTEDAANFKGWYFDGNDRIFSPVGVVTTTHNGYISVEKLVPLTEELEKYKTIKKYGKELEKSRYNKVAVKKTKYGKFCLKKSFAQFLDGKPVTVVSALLQMNAGNRVNWPFKPEDENDEDGYVMFDLKITSANKSSMKGVQKLITIRAATT